MISSGQVVVLLVIVSSLQCKVDADALNKDCFQTQSNENINLTCKSENNETHSAFCQCVLDTCKNISGQEESFIEKFWRGHQHFNASDINCPSWQKFCLQNDSKIGLKDCQFSWEHDEYFESDGSRNASGIRLIVRHIF